MPMVNSVLKSREVIEKEEKELLRKQEMEDKEKERKIELEKQMRELEEYEERMR